MRPRSAEGRSFVEVAHVLRGQLRVGMSAPVGLDATACLALIEGQGVHRDFASVFLPYWEAGLLEAFEEQRSEQGK